MIRLMQIKVKEEGREGIYLPDKESLIAFIKSKNFEQIHNFIPGPVMLGADHSVESVIEAIKSCDRIAVLLGSAYRNNMNHALSVIHGLNMEMYDIGEITANDLEFIVD